MRLDKFLKVSRIIKRRTVAADASNAGRVTVNGRIAKASTEVKEGDILELRFGSTLLKVEVCSLAKHAGKAEASELYKIIE